jgi:prepilin-type processing-associated H-X9-DG protein
MFHVELRQFPHVARAFNLTPEQLQTRVLGAWVRGQAVKLDDRHWGPEKARLTIYEGPALKPEEMGLGRSWANVTKNCTEATDQLLALERQAATSASVSAGAGQRAPQAVCQLQAEILERCATDELVVSELIELLSRRHPDWRVSDRIALAEQSIWQLLHEGRLNISWADGGPPLDKDAWGPVLLSWRTWSPEGDPAVSLGLADSDQAGMENRPDGSP